jgi:hypothetical protein
MQQPFREVHIQQPATSKVGVLSECARRAFPCVPRAGNIGGNMGMFMGMSLVTLAEVFVFLVKTLWALMCRSRHHLKTISRRKEEEKRIEKEGYGFSGLSSAFTVGNEYATDFSRYETIYDNPEWLSEHVCQSTQHVFCRYNLDITGRTIDR